MHAVMFFCVRFLENIARHNHFLRRKEVLFSHAAMSQPTCESGSLLESHQYTQNETMRRRVLSHPTVIADESNEILYANNLRQPSATKNGIHSMKRPNFNINLVLFFVSVYHNKSSWRSFLSLNNLIDFYD
jgi:hypothetical protein